MKLLTGEVCLAVLLGVAPAAAQTIRGTVYDPSGGVVPGVSVKIAHLESSAARTAATSEYGTFEFNSIAAGKYLIECEARGFRTARQYATLKPGETASIAVVLELGAVHETLKVSARGMPGETPQQNVRLGGKVEPPKLLKMIRPLYPEAAKNRGAAGTVILRAVILRDGSIGNLTAIVSPDPDLAAAATQAVQGWRYEPARLNGQPVEVETRIHIDFALAP